MLEDYYVKPSTVDRVRASWLAPQIETYLGWLEAHRYSRSWCIGLPLLFHFGEFAQKKGCKEVASCKAYIAAPLSTRACWTRIPHIAREAFMAVAPLPSVSSSPTPPIPPLSAGARILNTFIAPSKTFTDLGTHATGWSWVVPWLLISVAAIAFFAVVGQKIGFRKVAENQVAASPKATERMDRLAPDARERAMAQQAKGTQIFTEYLYPLTLLILNLIITAVLFATFTFGAGAKMAFKTAFAVITFAGLPGIVRLGLGIVSILAGTNPDSFSLQNPVATNPGYFLSPAESPFWFGVLSSVDVFLIWTLVLSAIGFTCVSKVKRGTAFAVVFGWWAIFSVGGAAIGAALS